MSILKPGTICSLIDVVNAGTIVEVGQHIGSIPKAGITDGYRIRTVDGQPFKFMKIFDGGGVDEATRKRVEARLDVCVIERQYLRPLFDHERPRVSSGQLATHRQVPIRPDVAPPSTRTYYPHFIMRVSNVAQRSPIEVRYGTPSVDICSDTPRYGREYVQHPEPFDADGSLSMACRTLLIAAVQGAARRSEFQMQRCLVWSPTSCSYIEADGSINNSSELPVFIAPEQCERRNES